MTGSIKEEETNEGNMPLLNHLIELRQRLIVSIYAYIAMFLLCYWQSKTLFSFLTMPLADAFHGQIGRRMIFTDLTEGFLTNVKIAAWGGLFLSFPVVAIQLWKFIAPGLYRNERRAFMPFLFATPILFFLGGGLAYYIIFPAAWRFFLSFEIPQLDGSLPIQLEAKISEYLSLVTKLIFAFGLSFEMPVLFTLLGRASLVSSKQLVAKWRYAVLGCTIVAAIITPGDVISMIGLAVPLVILYGLSIIGVKIVEYQRIRREAAAGASQDIKSVNDNKQN